MHPSMVGVFACTYAENVTSLLSLNPFRDKSVKVSAEEGILQGE